MGDGPTVTQTEFAMGHTLFRVSVYDGENIVAMARMIGDMGINYYINNNGVKGTNIFVELCAVPDKVPFYEKYGFSANEAQRLKLTHKVY